MNQLIDAPTKAEENHDKVGPFNPEADSTQWNLFQSAIVAGAARKGLTKCFRDDAVAVASPTLADMRAEEAYAGFTQLQWNNCRRDMLQRALSHHPELKRKDDALWEAAAALQYDLLWKDGQLMLDAIMRETVPFVRFTRIRNKIREEWEPTGIYRLSELQKQFREIDDSRGILKMFQDIQVNVNATELIPNPRYLQRMR